MTHRWPTWRRTRSCSSFGAGAPAAAAPFYHLLRAYYLSRVGRYREMRDHLRKDPGLGAKELASIVAIEQGEYTRTLEHAEGARKSLSLISREAVRDDETFALHLLAGVALARSGELEGARRHLDELEKLDRTTETRRWCHGALAGEIALAEGDLVSAESAIAGAEPTMKPAGPGDPRGSLFRDARARVEVARGDLAGALQTYRALTTPDIAAKWTAVLEPRYVLAVARLLDEMGRHEEARQEYERFLQFWKDADEGLPELAEARAYLASAPSRP